MSRFEFLSILFLDQSVFLYVTCGKTKPENSFETGALLARAFPEISLPINLNFGILDFVEKFLIMLIAYSCNTFPPNFCELYYTHSPFPRISLPYPWFPWFWRTVPVSPSEHQRCRKVSDMPAKLVKFACVWQKLLKYWSECLMGSSNLVFVKCANRSHHQSGAENNLVGLVLLESMHTKINQNVK